MITHPPRLDGTVPGSSAGVLAPNVDIRILSTENKPLGIGELGEVVSRSPSNAVRPSLPECREASDAGAQIDYLDNAKATEETFDKEGFVHTGDEGYIDDKVRLARAGP